MQEVIKELKKRIEALKDKNSVAVVYHFDMDGCASASLLWRYFQLNNINATFLPATRGYEGMTIDKIAKFQPDKIILLDYIPGRELMEYIKNYDTEIIDHHTHEKHLEEFDYFTSADKGVPEAVCYSLTKTFEELGMTDIAWLGKLGSYWDKTLENTEYYYEGIYEKEIEEMLPFNLVVSFTQTKGSEHIFEVFNESSSFKEALEKIKKLDDYHRAEKVFKEEFREIEFSRKDYPKIQLGIYWIRTKFKHIRVYVDYISYLKKGTKIFILDENIRFKFSLRTSLEINLVDIIREIHSENDKFNGGGHPKAAGAMLDNPDVEELLGTFIKKYTKVLESKEK